MSYYGFKCDLFEISKGFIRKKSPKYLVLYLINTFIILRFTFITIQIIKRGEMNRLFKFFFPKVRKEKNGIG